MDFRFYGKFDRALPQYTYAQIGSFIFDSFIHNLIYSESVIIFRGKSGKFCKQEFFNFVSTMWSLRTHFERAVRHFRESNYILRDLVSREGMYRMYIFQEGGLI